MFISDRIIYFPIYLNKIKDKNIAVWIKHHTGLYVNFMISTKRVHSMYTCIFLNIIIIVFFSYSVLFFSPLSDNILLRVFHYYYFRFSGFGEQRRCHLPDRLGQSRSERVLRKHIRTVQTR